MHTRTTVTATAVLVGGLTLAQGGGTGETAAMADLNAPEYSPADCPAWARENVPDWVKPYMGINGAPEPWRPKGKPFGSAVAGLDRYQANLFVWYGPATAEYLYTDYTPLTVPYKPGTLPAFETAAARFTAGCATDTAKALALLTRAMPDLFRHPGMPPRGGDGVRADRNLDDEALLASGIGWCNEQARVFIRLCQVSGIPARMIHLFGQNHTVAEFYADGRWVMADSTSLFVAPGEDGALLSAAQCHDGGANQRLYAEAKERRMRAMAGMPDDWLGFADPKAAAQWREEARKPFADELATRPVAFGVINYPLPE